MKKLLEKDCWKNSKNMLTKIKFESNIYFAVAKATLHICDSGVVGNARPCQGRDRGFEPRLSLFLCPEFDSGLFLYLARTCSAE